MVLTIYAPLFASSKRAVVTLVEKGVSFETVNVDLMKGEQRQPDQTWLLTRRLSSLLLLSLLSPLIVFIILPIPLLSDSPVQSEINLISPCDVQSQLRKKFPKLNDPLLSLGILMTSLHLLLLLPSGLVSRL
jgi:hypothetical protein